MEDKIVLYGASGHCKVIIDLLQKSNMQINYIVDDNPSCNTILGLEVKRFGEICISDDTKMIISIGSNAIRKKLVESLNGIQFAKLIHPQAIISNNAVIQSGTVIMAGVVVNASASIGSHVIINTGAVIEHDCKIADFVHISPNASLAGGVIVEEGSQVGIGACVIQNVKIGKWATIGAGSVVIRDVPDYAIVVGNPARIIKNNTDE